MGGGASSGLDDEDCHLRTSWFLFWDCDVRRLVTRRDTNERHWRDATDVRIMVNVLWGWLCPQNCNQHQAQKNPKSSGKDVVVSSSPSDFCQADGEVCPTVREIQPTAKIRRSGKNKRHIHNNNNHAFLTKDAPKKGIHFGSAMLDYHGNDEPFFGKRGREEVNQLLSIVDMFSTFHSCSAIIGQI